MKKAVIAGGSGFLGKAIIKAFGDAGYDVVVLSRTSKPVPGSRVVQWDGKGPGAWYEEVNGADVVINLCGLPVMAKWTSAYKDKLRESRIGPTCLIGAAIAAGDKPAGAWINASAVGWYGDTGHREVSEASPHSDDFLGNLCKAWEDEVDKAVTPATRKVKIRIGVVLGPGGGLFDVLSKVTKMFAGGALGSGKQYMPWIHIDDLARMFLWAAENPIHGAVNGTSPYPVTNESMMASFRQAFGRPPVPPLPGSVVKSICGFMGWEPQLLLGGTRAVPALAISQGFTFRYEDLDEALAATVDDVPKAWRPKEGVA